LDQDDATTWCPEEHRRSIVNDVAPLLEIVAWAVAVMLPPILLHRLASHSDWPGLEAIFRVPLDAPWPRGVQEEEPGPWRFEALSRRQLVLTDDAARLRETNIP
jgi:hypothetical protein